MSIRFFMTILSLLFGFTQCIEASSWTAYVTNYGGGGSGGGTTVTPIEIATNIVGATISGPTGTFDGPLAIVITPDGTTAYVANQTQSSFLTSVIPIDIATNTTGTPISEFSNPFSLAISPDGTKAYVANSGANNVLIIDLANNTVIGTITSASFNDPGGIAITPDGTKAYVTNYMGNSGTTVTPIDLTTNPPTPGSAISGFAGPFAIAISPDGTTAYVTNAAPKVIAIDIATNTTTTITVSDSSLIGIAITPDGTKAYVASFNDDVVIPIDLTTNPRTVGTVISSPGLSNPFGIAITPDGTAAYVANISGNSVTMISIPQNTTQTLSSSNFDSPIWVAITPDQAPVAEFTVTTGIAGLPSLFDASSSFSPVGTIASYAWDFGDGGAPLVTTNSQVIHTYSLPGSYLVSLTVTNSAGTSTTQVFTGQTMSRNGGPSAFTESLVTINQIPTATTLTVAPNPSTFGQSVSLSATVTNISASPGTPTGQVSFFDGNTLLGAVNLSSNGQAILTLSSLSVGSHSITAVYGGNSIFALSTSAAVTLTINPVVPKILSPTHLRGVQLINRFATQADRVNVLSWKPPTKGLSPVSYHIYRDFPLKHPIAKIAANESLRFEDHNRRHDPETYFIVSVDASGRTSKPAKVTILPARSE